MLPNARRSCTYILDIDPDQIDYQRYRKLTAAAGDRAAAGRHAAAIDAYRQALDLWTGPPLANVRSGADGLRQRLQDEYHATVYKLLTQQLHSGDHDQAYTTVNRLLGAHPGPDIDTYAAAALLDTTLPEAGGLLEQLLDAHLLEEPVPGRYRFHDLTRPHAAHTAMRDETENGRREAADRLLDYYRHTASVAMNAAYPYERDRRPQVPPAGTPSPDLSDPRTARRWLDGELASLLAAAQCATGHGRPEYLLQLSTILHRHLRTRGSLVDAVALHQYEEALEHYQQALRLARANGNRPGELQALGGVGWIHHRQGRYQEATDHYQRLLDLAHESGSRNMQFEARQGLGRLHHAAGHSDAALTHHDRALALAGELGQPEDQARAHDGLARAQVYRVSLTGTAPA